MGIYLWPFGEFEPGDLTEEKHVFQCPHCRMKIPIVIRGNDLKGVTVEFIKAKHN